ncbi:MAG: hypothetical protein HOI80_05235 [Alphaproteobacteria bacterium]|jgi:hypothetical protein|nr:hypothetical protein [Alphaproteobacteria bacterium]MBT5390524.1 hypothetical protein [Alphaproteobacteria bacterium]MBT5540358.1 hypothetical protein [Alphaproteobacteria bacterium]MBT5654881.1 hypothetical protein [Alphaproteobacteria bacterium]
MKNFKYNVVALTVLIFSGIGLDGMAHARNSSENETLCEAYKQTNKCKATYQKCVKTCLGPPYECNHVDVCRVHFDQCFTNKIYTVERKLENWKQEHRNYLQEQREKIDFILSKE